MLRKGRNMLCCPQAHPRCSSGPSGSRCRPLGTNGLLDPTEVPCRDFIYLFFFKSAAKPTRLLLRLLPSPPQGPSPTRSAAAQRHPCLLSTWRRRPSPAANHRAPSQTSRAFLLAPLRLVTERRTGEATPPFSHMLIMLVPPLLFGSSTSH